MQPFAYIKVHDVPAIVAAAGLPMKPQITEAMISEDLNRAFGRAAEEGAHLDREYRPFECRRTTADTSKSATRLLHDLGLPEDPAWYAEDHGELTHISKPLDILLYTVAKKGEMVSLIGNDFPISLEIAQNTLQQICRTLLLTKSLFDYGL
jgi:hypothetical protein